MTDMILTQPIVLNNVDLEAEVTYYTSVEDDQCLLQHVRLNDVIVYDVIALLGREQFRKMTSWAEEAFTQQQNP